MIIRLLYVNSDPDRSERSILKKLSSRGVVIRALVSPESIINNENEYYGVDIHPISFHGRISITGINTIKHHLNEFNPNISYFLTNQALTNGLIASRGFKTKIVAYRGIGANFSIFNPFAWMRYLNPRVDKIICVCKSIEASLKKIIFFKIPKNQLKLVTIYKGHDVAWYEEQVKKGPTPSKDLNTMRLICVANWRPRKGLEVLLDAMNKLRPDLLIELIVIGKGVNQKKFQNLASRSSYKNAIRLLGFRKDAINWMGTADVSILPSIKREGLPRCVIEAMSLGLPQIVSNIGGSPELVTSQMHGFVIEPGDAKGIANAIERFYDHRKEMQSMGKAAKERIREDFHIDESVKELYGLYISLLKNQNKST